MNEPRPAIESIGICKSFPGVRALEDVSVAVKEGSCHALMGENGAGKSTLGKILSGLYQPDAGEMRLAGRTVRFLSPIQAIQAGVSIVHQELAFCDNLSVEENLCLEDLPVKGVFLDRSEMRRRAVDWLGRIQADVDPGDRLGDLPIGKQQMVQIAGAVGRGAKVLIFDEPTSSLSQRETDALFEQIRSLQRAGVTCIYVSHRMAEIFELCDTVTVLRDGRLVDTVPVEGLGREDLVRMMIGRAIEQVAEDRRPKQQGGPMLEVEGLTSPGKFSDITFAVARGEVVGLAGLVGAGRTEIAEAIFGVDSRAHGTVRIEGREAQFNGPSDAMASGVGLVPEDRKRQGLVLMMNARENISLPTLGRISKAGFVKSREERALAQKYFDAMRVRAPHLDSATAGLSGGNQQKLVIAKWLGAQCNVLILDEPTRGVDVGAKAEIHDLIRSLAAEGKAVLAISSELPELIGLCTRILVVRDGRIVGEVAGSEATEEHLMRMMTGVDTAAQRNGANQGQNG